MNNPSGTCIVRYTRKFSTRESVSILARTPTQNTTQRFYFTWICAWRSQARIYIYIYIYMGSSLSLSLSLSFSYLNLFIEIYLLTKAYSSDTNNRFTRFISLALFTYWSDCVGFNRERKRKRDLRPYNDTELKNTTTYKISRRRMYVKQKRNLQVALFR
jgi:hypothetical protein